MWFFSLLLHTLSAFAELLLATSVYHSAYCLMALASAMLAAEHTLSARSIHNVLTHMCAHGHMHIVID